MSSLLYVCRSCDYSCCWFFFFFKQKTAYEMRISDWSSDVCSSDLSEIMYATVRPGSDCSTARDWVATACTVTTGSEGAAERPSDLQAASAIANVLEIGRASCRERVCQYV